VRRQAKQSLVACERGARQSSMHASSLRNNAASRTSAMAVRPAIRKLAPDLCACSRTSPLQAVRRVYSPFSLCASPVLLCRRRAEQHHSSGPTMRGPTESRAKLLLVPRTPALFCLVLTACLMTLTAFALACQPRHVLPGLHTHDLSSIGRRSCLREH
jgi:hypothetical protein